MSPLSFTPTLPCLLLRHHLNRSPTVLSLLSSSPFSSHCLYSKPPPILPVHDLYHIPHATTSRISSPSSRPRFAAAAVSGGALLQDAGATTAVLAGAYVLVLVFDTLTQRKLIQQALYLSSVHHDYFFCQLEFAFDILCSFFENFTFGFLIGTEFEQKIGSYIIWFAFRYFLANFQNSTSTEARYFATLVPLVNGLRLVIHGLSLASNEGLIKSVTREGKPEELLKGPLYYVLILILCALVFWRESPIGLISLAMMCGGDGVADIVGRRFGSMKLPYNLQKSWVGSISMFISGFLFSMGMLYYYSALGYFDFGLIWTMKRVALVALVATIVESLPITETIDDNISVPLTSILAAYLSFGF